MRRLAVILGVIGVAGVIAGIALEAVLHSDIGFFIITGSSVMIATGGFIWSKVYGKE